MKFSHFKASLDKNKDELIINKTINIQGKEVKLLTFSEDNDCNKLWTLTISDFNEESEIVINEFKNNREFLIYNNLRSLDSVSVPIRNIILQGHTINIECSSINRIDFVDKSIIKHFLDIGLLDDIPDAMESINILLTAYHQEYGGIFPYINADKPLDINIDVDIHNYEELILHKTKMKIGQYEKGTKIRYLNNNGEEEYFFVNAITKEDMWEDAVALFNRINNNENLSDDDKIQLIEDYKRTLENTCPKGKVMLTLEYETPDNIQLRFLTKEYLEKPVEFNESFSSFMVGPSSEKGQNGNISSYEYLIAVDENFNDEIELELFSKYVTIKACGNFTSKGCTE